MKALVKSGLCLALGWAVARSDAQETRWRSATAAPSGAVAASGVAQPGGITRVSLNPPQPLPEAAPALPPPLVRGQIPDERPLPLGPAALGDAGLPAPRPMGPAISSAPPPAGFAGSPPPSSTVPFTAPLPQPLTSQGPLASPGPQTFGPAPGLPMPGPGMATPAPGPIVDGNRIWGTTLPPNACDCCGDCCPPCGTASCCPSSCFGSRFMGLGCCNSGSFFGSCADPCCNTRCNGGLFWVNAEYLLWFVRSQSTPPLVTTSPLGTPANIAGIPGLPTTTTVFDHINNNPYSGGRFSAGFWFPRCNDWGLDASYFFLAPRSDTHTFGTANGVEVFRPVTDVSQSPPAPFPQAVSFGQVTGAVAVHDYTQLWGAEINLRKRLCCGCNYWFDVLGGYRHFNLTEGIDITENLTLPAEVDPRTGQFINNGLFQQQTIYDSFRTVNNFDGGQLGVQGQWNFAGRWFIGGGFKLAMGNVHQTLDINGVTTLHNPAPGALNGTFPGGVLALPGTNIGHFSQNRFAVLPELNMKVGLDITQHLRAYVGYDFLYISSVIRPNDQIDTNVNRTLVPGAGVPVVGPARPAVLFRTTDFWAQGLNFGLQYHW
jgi:hypothetical protein